MHNLFPKSLAFVKTIIFEEKQVLQQKFVLINLNYKLLT